MLIMFRAKNYMSFKDDVILDMRATSLHEHSSHIIQIDDNKILKTMAVYGANASGKSCLISAMFYYEQFIKKNLFPDDLNDNLKNNEYADRRALRFRAETFALNSFENNEIEMEMIFSSSGTIYQYGFSINKSIISSEWLFVDNVLVYERIKKDINPGKKYKNELIMYSNNLRDDRLFIGILDYFSTGKLKEIVDNIKDYFQEKFQVYFEVSLEFSVKGTETSVDFNPRMFKDKVFRDRVARFVESIDTGITNLIEGKTTKKNIVTGETKEIPEIRASHSIYTGNEISGAVTFDLSRESTGTLRFISYIQQALLMLEHGGVFIIDELTARFHPLLTKMFIGLFQSDKNKNTQLIFTTHDASLLNKEQFRRDEIAFIEKNIKGESKMFTLSDLKVRSDASYSKDYFNGKYGAIPIIEDIFNEDGEISGKA